MSESAPKNRKRLIFCFDGTWNRLSTDCLTNVALLAQMVCPTASDGKPQIVYYDEGIGTGRRKLGKLFDGAFGRGMIKIMREAYRFLIFNYEAGDEIFIFGFSRGAYTARSFAGFIRHAGILDIAHASQIDTAIELYRNARAGTGEESEAAQKFRAEHCTGICVSAADRDWRKEKVPGFDAKAAQLLSIRYLGVWDTVRALGLPDYLPFAAWNNRKYRFHNAVLTSKIKAARHAVALDERRRAFRPTLFGAAKVDELNARNQRKGKPPMPEWQTHYLEKWFPGVHGAVGGGGSRRGLSDAALEWVLAGARQAGLQLRDQDDNPVFALRPDPFDALQNDPHTEAKAKHPVRWLLGKLGAPRKGPDRIDDVSLAALRRWSGQGAAPYRPLSLNQLSAELDAWPYRSVPEWKSEEPPLEDYALQRDDTLSKLAKARLGDAKRWKELYDLNRDRIDNPHFLAIGTVLRLPAALRPTD